MNSNWFRNVQQKWTPPTPLLLQNLPKTVPPNDLVAWMRDWLTSRKHRVLLNRQTSEWLPLTSAVSQGPVLKPIFFHNTHQCSRNKAGIIYLEVCRRHQSWWKNSQDLRLRHHLKGPLLNYPMTEKWQMSFNVKKCKVMHLRSKKKNHAYNLHDRPLQDVKEESDLGVIRSDLKHTKNC